MDRWHSIYNNEISNLKGAVERLGNDQSRAFSILEDRLELLTDMKHVYSRADTLQKREFVNMVFDSNLYYENGIYRTPTMFGLLSHNHLKRKEKGLLIYEKKEGLLNEDPLSGERGIRTPGPVTVNSFQDCRNRPLCHFSLKDISIFDGANIAVFFILTNFTTNYCEKKQPVKTLHVL